MLERIWSGWRSSYVAGSPVRIDDDSQTDGMTAGGSVFRRLLESGESDEATHIVHRGAEVFAIVNIYPYTSGHLLVLPYREVADLDGLTGSESAELWATVTDAVRVARAVYRPDGMNVGLNLGRPAGGSVPTHLHVHVVPRWTGDSNFMSSIANTQTLPEALTETASKLRNAWPA
jgi:diadenosine tetraphosphate (Ap4A) HIT family hydrolase